MALTWAIGRLPLAGWEATGGLALAAIIASAVGIGTSARAENFFRRTDPPPVVIDEVAGQMVTFLACPQASGRWLWAGFLLFRVFDIIKPFPARRAERLRRGWGIVADDIVAGAYSVGALALSRYVLR